MSNLFFMMIVLIGTFICIAVYSHRLYVTMTKVFTQGKTNIRSQKYGCDQ